MNLALSCKTSGYHCTLENCDYFNVHSMIHPFAITKFNLQKLEYSTIAQLYLGIGLTKKYTKKNIALCMGTWWSRLRRGKNNILNVSTYSTFLFVLLWFTLRLRLAILPCLTSSLGIWWHLRIRHTLGRCTTQLRASFYGWEQEQTRLGAMFGGTKCKHLRAIRCIFINVIFIF